MLSFQGEGMVSQPFNVSFSSGLDTCRGWHFAPLAGTFSHSCIVMAHGFGGTMEDGLLPYARHFSDAGFHVLLFDYRHFGASGGQPRQLLSIQLQLQDWRAAVAFARGIEGVRSDRIGLWGTSLSGGHVVKVAAQDKTIAAVSSQCPLMSGLEAVVQSTRETRPLTTLRATFWALLDWMGGRIGLSPILIPIVGPPGTMAAMSTPDAQPGYQAIASNSFKNQVAARIVLSIPGYNPEKVIHRLKCPILIQVCNNDALAPPPAARKAAGKTNQSELVQYPLSHFEIYTGKHFDKSVIDQLEFFTKHLGS